MAEYPTAQPTEDLSYATAGIKTASSASDKADGFEIGDYPDEEVVNYRWDGQKEHVDYVESIRPRVFDSFVEAIDETSPMDLVVFGVDQHWSDAYVLKSRPAGTITHMASDGRRIYYTIGTMLYGATANNSTDANVEWSVDVLSSNWDAISTDGAIVALVHNNSFKVYNASTGALIIALAATGLDGEGGLVCDSDSNDYRAWFGSDTPSGLYKWTLAGGITLVAAESGLVTTSQSSVMLLKSSSIMHIDKINEGIIGSFTLPDTLLSGEEWTHGRDDLPAYGGRTHSSPPYYNIASNGRLIEPGYPDTTREANEPGVWGDGRLFTRIRAINERGVADHFFEFSNLDPSAFSGQFYYIAQASTIRVQPIEIKKGSLWLRKSDGTDGNFDGRSESGLRLLTRVLW